MLGLAIVLVVVLVASVLNTRLEKVLVVAIGLPMSNVTAVMETCGS